MGIKEHLVILRFQFSNLNNYICNDDIQWNSNSELKQKIVFER